MFSSNIGIIYSFFFFKLKTAYDMRISDWSSDVCSSDLAVSCRRCPLLRRPTAPAGRGRARLWHHPGFGCRCRREDRRHCRSLRNVGGGARDQPALPDPHRRNRRRSEEHTSELQSLMRISYAVFCLKKKNKNTHTQNT